jgi:hypothetical protein
MIQLRTCACLLALLTAGCAATGGQAPPAAAGHLAGQLVMEGGPLGPGGQQPGERPLSGTVTFTAAGHRRVTVQVGSSGKFSVRLPPGTYQISGGSPFIETSSGSGGNEEEFPCSQPLTAKVTAGHTANVTVTCYVP